MSVKLRKRFSLDRYLLGFVISGDTGIHRPDRAIYVHLLGRSGFQAKDVVFVDDRVRNVSAADAPGISSVLYNPAPEELLGHEFAIAKIFKELLNYLYHQGNQDSPINERSENDENISDRIDPALRRDDGDARIGGNLRKPFKPQADKHHNHIGSGRCSGAFTPPAGSGTQQPEPLQPLMLCLHSVASREC